jgi:hypothetical protein
VVQVLDRSAARGTARQVLAGYAYFGNPDGTSITAEPKSVARKAGVSLRTLERYRPRLIELGELVVVARDKPGEHLEYAIRLPGQNPQAGDSEARQNRQQNRQPADPGDTARARGRDPEDPGVISLPSSAVAGAREGRPSPIGDLMGWGS